jgi:hypothetical protein
VSGSTPRARSVSSGYRVRVQSPFFRGYKCRTLFCDYERWLAMKTHVWEASSSLLALG